MKIKHEKSNIQRRKKLTAKAISSKCVLRLYIAGQTPKAVTALNNLKSICKEHLKGKYQIEKIDLLKYPQLGRDDQIVAIPTLMTLIAL